MVLGNAFKHQLTFSVCISGSSAFTVVRFKQLQTGNLFQKSENHWVNLAVFCWKDVADDSEYFQY